MARLLALGLAGLLCGWVSAQAQVYGGELIVKFDAGHEVNTPVREVLQNRGDRPQEELYAGIRRHVVDLSEQTGIPLGLIRVTSGGELILAIERQALLDTLAKRIRSRPGVNAVEIALDSRDRVLSARDELRVDIDPGVEPFADLHDAATADVIVAALLDNAPGGLSARRLSPHQLSLTVQVQRVAIDLAGRLAAHSGIAYAQPNFALRPYDPPRASKLSPVAPEES